MSASKQKEMVKLQKHMLNQRKKRYAGPTPRASKGIPAIIRDRRDRKC